MGYEALTRGPEGSPLESAPALFAWAKNTGVLPQLDAASRRLAIERWAGAAPDRQLGHPLRLFLNVHPLSLAQPGEAQALNPQWVQEARIPFESVVLELTEAAPLDDGKAVLGALGRFRQQGFAIGIDDLGAGHSSLGSLLTVKPEFVKIDRSLVDHVDQDRVRQHLIVGIMEAAHAASGEVVAEGIERTEELRFLASVGVDMGQGFLLARPGPALAAVHPSVIEELRTVVLGEEVPSFRRPTAGDLADPVVPVGLEARLATLVRRFEEDPSLEALPVVDGSRPVALIRRNRLMQMLGARAGRSALLRHPVQTLAERSPLTVDASATLSRVAYRVAHWPDPAIGGVVTVTERGRYRGLLSVRQVLRRMAQLQAEPHEPPAAPGGDPSASHASERAALQEKPCPPSPDPVNGS